MIPTNLWERISLPLLLLAFLILVIVLVPGVGLPERRLLQQVRDALGGPQAQPQVPVARQDQREHLQVVRVVIE